MDVDPYENAKNMNDQFALNSWAKYEKALLAAPVVAISPKPFLQYEHPEATNEYGAPPEIWEESTRQILDIYEQSFARAIAQYVDSVKLDRRSYTPPSGYGKGGPVSYPIELIQIIYDQSWLMDVGIAVVHAIVAEAVIGASRTLRQWMRKHKVPDSEQVLPSHNPFIVKAVVEHHAHRCFPNLTPGTSTIHSGFPLDADYPARGDPFLVTLPYPKGSIVYLIDDKLRRPLIIRTTPAGSRELDSSGWLSNRKVGAARAEEGNRPWSDTVATNPASAEVDD